jgi:uncharacterized protein YacL
MKRVLAVVAGIVSGLLIAGLLAPPLLMVAPPRLRAAGTLWVVTALSVALAVWAFWSVSRPHRD